LQDGFFFVDVGTKSNEKSAPTEVRRAIFLDSCGLERARRLSKIRLHRLVEGIFSKKESHIFMTRHHSRKKFLTILAKGKHGQIASFSPCSAHL
jgi:hypothetical protein